MRLFFLLFSALALLTACQQQPPRAVAAVCPVTVKADSDTTAASPHKTALERRIEAQGLRDIAEEIPEVRISLMYGRADNFTGRVLYTDLHHAYLHPEAITALRKAAKALAKERADLALIVFDAARPMAIQQRMWDVVRGTAQQNYVSNPAHGGGLHNYGLAVDISLCQRATGDTITMGTVVDHLGRLAHVREEATFRQRRQISATALANRRLLRRVMSAGGWRVLPTEWWHFNLRTRAQAKAHYQVIP